LQKNRCDAFISARFGAIPKIAPAPYGKDHVKSGGKLRYENPKHGTFDVVGFVLVDVVFVAKRRAQVHSTLRMRCEKQPVSAVNVISMALRCREMRNHQRSNGGTGVRVFLAV